MDRALESFTLDNLAGLAILNVENSAM